MKKMFFVLAGMLFISSVTNAQAKKDSASFNDFYGKFKFEAGSPIDEATILWNGSTLAISTSMGDATMAQLGTDSFSMSYADGTILFKRGADKEVNQIVILVSGTSLEGKKDVPGEATYAEYYGKYKFEAGAPIDEATILWKDGSVQISTAMGDATMAQLGVDSFSMSYADGTVLFKRGEDKKVNKIQILVSGTTLEGKKD